MSLPKSFILEDWFFFFFFTLHFYTRLSLVSFVLWNLSEGLDALTSFIISQFFLFWNNDFIANLQTFKISPSMPQTSGSLFFFFLPPNYWNNIRLIKSVIIVHTERCVVFWPVKILKVGREKQYWALCPFGVSWRFVGKKDFRFQEAPFSAIRQTEGSTSLCLFLIMSLWINSNCLCKWLEIRHSDRVWLGGISCGPLGCSLLQIRIGRS